MIWSVLSTVIYKWAIQKHIQTVAYIDNSHLAEHIINFGE